ncbi:hypothetical protein INP83_11280 [Mucilaginibacter sp. 21P]|uniref:hypothetical protein n=1 Tax=Mucilaginibacter sp. 21P TaxID=2778902 RepID=UPI001C58E6FD|nr:hypothetical protein [Mucilaginibacter sp. 21P]QXV63693.1 hypothetical protein INP83_11280 [Mucilaginibacter sp. 21P]
MGKSTWITLTVLAALFSTYLFAGTDVIGLSGKNPSSDSVLLQTHCKQMGGFERYTPDHMRFGCWSTALAQIIYDYKLKSFGRVRYTSREGFAIDEQLNSSDDGQNFFSKRWNQLLQIIDPVIDHKFLVRRQKKKWQVKIKSFA